jgi:ABC-2 type transport system ATP-binding protein
VFPGEVFGFLGPNGAGKTTTIKMLTGLARPDAGHIHYYGEEYTGRIKAAQNLFGVVPDTSSLYPELTGRDNLEFCAALYGVKREERRRRAGELLAVFDLEKAADRRFSGYSRGMGRRLSIAAALIHRPRLLFLDEPTTGVDVPNAREIRRLLAGLSREGTTIFLTTHYIEEAERLCDRVAFIVEGRIVRCDTVDNLLEELRGRRSLELELDAVSDGFLDHLRASFPDIEWESRAGSRLRVHSDGEIDLVPLVTFLADHGRRVLEAQRIRQNLEEVFIRVTGVEAERLQQEKGGGRG